MFIRNYAWAITHPTQRVWKNEMIDEKFESIKPELNITQGTTSRDTTAQAGSAEIIGGSADLPSTQFIEPATLNEIDQEEQKELERIQLKRQRSNGCMKHNAGRQLNIFLRS